MSIDEIIAAAKWEGEPCHNPKKGWITDSKGKRLTRLGNRNALGKLIVEHNKQLDYLAHKIKALGGDNG